MRCKIHPSTRAFNLSSSSIYSDIDFERLYQRKVTPPFNPKVKSAADMKFVPSTYHKMPVSPVDTCWAG